jgi:hypothetical protein
MPKEVREHVRDEVDDLSVGGRDLDACDRVAVPVNRSADAELVGVAAEARRSVPLLLFVAVTAARSVGRIRCDRGAGSR